ncbi:hypothetical protein ABFV99_02275 [Cytobacillus horneckiae]
MDIEKSVLIKHITNDVGSVFNEIIKINDTVSVATLHIVKIESIED